MKKVIIRVLLPLVVVAAAWYGYRFFKMLPQRQEHVATTRVRKGDVVIRAYSRGELRAVRSVTLTAPNLYSTVQVTRLAAMGALAKDKDLIVEFDDSERRAQLEEGLLTVEQIDEQIKKAKADLAIRDQQDQVDLLKARFAVRRAELEVKRNPILSAIDAKKNLLSLEEARKRLSQLQSDIKSRQAQAQAELAVFNENRNKSMIDVAREKQRIAQAKVLSPMTGLVAVKQNRSGFFMFGQQMPDIREGDTLAPGIPVADVLDLSELEVVAKVGELDRANLHEGQDVLITLDAVPAKQIHGRIKSMSGTASANVFSGDPAKKFDVVFGIDMKQLLTELGVKPAEVQRILETAQRNASKAPAATVTLGGGGRPGQGPGNNQAQAGGAPGAPAPPGTAGAIPAAPFGAPMPNMPGGQQPTGGPGPAAGGAAGQVAGGQPGGGQVAGGQRGGGGGGRRSRGDEPGTGSAAEFIKAAAAKSKFSEADLANAKLPPPPEESTQLDVLLRPGLLADVQIIIEKIPSALHVPVQAVFEKEGKPIVYVQKGSNFEARRVEIAKRSESTMVLASGVKPDEVVALADPFSRKGSKREEPKKGGSGNPMGGVPAGGGGGK
jgi:HlyD family secretion protein